MNLAWKISLWTVWVLAGTLLYARVWSGHLDDFPELPEQLGLWVASLTGLTNSDDVEQLTFWYVLIVSFTVVVAFTVVAWGAFRLLRMVWKR